MKALLFTSWQDSWKEAQTLMAALSHKGCQHTCIQSGDRFIVVWSELGE